MSRLSRRESTREKGCGRGWQGLWGKSCSVGSVGATDHGKSNVLWMPRVRRGRYGPLDGEPGSHSGNR